MCLSLAKNLHEFWTRGPEFRSDGQFVRVCGTQAQYQFFLDYVRPWLAFIVIMVIPFVLILFFNCAIVHVLIRAQRTRKMAAANQTGNGNPPPKSGFRQTTLMCLSISFAFLICIAPSIVLLIGKPTWKRPGNFAYTNAKAISNLLGFVNHCVNFFLYCVSGRRFRHELAALFTCRRTEVARPSVTSLSDANTTSS